MALVQITNHTNRRVSINSFFGQVAPGAVLNKEVDSQELEASKASLDGLQSAGAITWTVLADSNPGDNLAESTIGGAVVLAYPGDPTGVVEGQTGWLCTDITNGALYLFTGGAWAEVALV